MSHHTEGLCRIDGVDCYRILDTHLMAPFLLTVVSPEEHRTLVRGAAAHLKLTERMANVSLNLKVDEQRTDVDVLRGGQG